MSEKETAPEGIPDEAESKKTEKPVPKSEDLTEEAEEIEEPPVKVDKKSKEKKVSKKRAKLSVLQAAGLETIRERPQRPRAIQTIIYSAGGVEIPRNEIIRSLNELREKGLVEKVTAQAWPATGW